MTILECSVFSIAFVSEFINIHYTRIGIKVMETLPSKAIYISINYGPWKN